MNEFNKDGTIEIEFGDANSATEQENTTEPAFKPAERPEEPAAPPEPGTKEFFEHAAKAAEPKEEQETEEQPKPAKQESKGKGYDRVEFDDPAVQERFNRVYRQVKASDANVKELANQNRLLMEKLDQIEKEKLEQNKTKALTDLQKEITNHQKRGEYELANEKLRKQIKLESEETPFESIEETARKKYEESTPLEQRFVAQMTEEQQERVVAFLDQHPYAVNDQIKAAALKRGAEVWKANPNLNLRTIAESIDQELNRLGKAYSITPKNTQPTEQNINKKNAPAEVISGDRVSGKANNRVTLTQEEARVATKIFPELSKEEAYKRYAYQKTLVR